MTRALGRAGMLTLLLAAVLAAPAAASHVQCGDTITADTTLDSDLTCSGDGLTVFAPGVTLDFAGNTITGSGTDEGVIVWADHVTIRNGTIRDFSRGVDTDGTRGTALRRMVLHRNRTGIHCQYAPECRIEDSVVRRNGFGVVIRAADGGDPQPTILRRNVISHNGIGVQITGEAAIVAGNRVEDNGGDGIVNDYGRPVTIARNVVTGNGGEGVNIFFGASATITDNRIVGNATDGVGVHGGSGEGTGANVADNRIARNGRDGVLVEGVDTSVTVERNRTDRNGDDGIDVDFVDHVTVVRANKAFFNADLGIEAAPGTTDGGANKAKHNGDPAQCVGVSCK